MEESEASYSGRIAATPGRWSTQQRESPMVHVTSVVVLLRTASEPCLKVVPGSPLVAEVARGRARHWYILRVRFLSIDDAAGFWSVQLAAPGAGVGVRSGAGGTPPGPTRTLAVEER